MESVPPRLYGGTERVVSYLTEELVRQGHEVTLFASGDSITEARLIPCTKRALRLCGVDDTVPYHLIMLDRVARSADGFDILHFHIDALHYPVISRFARRTVTTLHGRLDLPDLHALYAAFDHVPLVSISNSQRRAMPPVNWAGCVHHGLPRELLTPRRRNPNRESSGYGHSDGYLAFLGRISPEKRADRAIEIAVRTGRELRIAAKIDKVDRNYWRNEIEPLVKRHPNVRYVGEIGEADKADFLGTAAALLFPIDWAEPFGLTMIEAMACGTPVIAWDIASVPEVVDDEVTGFIVGSINDAVAAVRRLPGLDRRRIRAVFERRFTAHRMARDYIAIYRRLLADNWWPRPINGSRAADDAMP
ncbi:Glycosyltransferase involved in cell wall bisynthesis [Rhodospirillales bacterium URHD0017]|nr:Glycosyltransferase involved in cell wall bisynthesis [Rhodospirillales bacterium URHD0017]